MNINNLGEHCSQPLSSNYEAATATAAERNATLLALNYQVYSSPRRSTAVTSTLLHLLLWLRRGHIHNSTLALSTAF